MVVTFSGWVCVGIFFTSPFSMPTPPMQVVDTHLLWISDGSHLPLCYFRSSPFPPAQHLGFTPVMPSPPSWCLAGEAMFIIGGHFLPLFISSCVWCCPDYHFSWHTFALSKSCLLVDPSSSPLLTFFLAFALTLHSSVLNLYRFSSIPVPGVFDVHSRGCLFFFFSDEPPFSPWWVCPDTPTVIRAW